MSVNLRRFVNVNITRANRSVINPSRDTVALFGAVTTDFATFPVDATSVTLTSGVSLNEDEYRVTGIAHFAADVDKSFTAKFTKSVSGDFPILKKYAQRFFENNGVKLFVTKEAMSVASIKALPQEMIGIASLASTAPAGFCDIVDDYNDEIIPEEYPVDEEWAINTSAAKIFARSYIATNTNSESALDNELAGIGVTTGTESNPSHIVENICWKNGNPGIEMTPLAYLSQINAYEQNSVADYAFTVERIDRKTVLSVMKQAEADQVDVYTSDILVGGCMKNNFNVDTIFVGDIANIGGNLRGGLDLVNTYMTIVMTQTIEAAVANALKSKPAGAEGTAKIYNVAATECNRYVQNGLLAPSNWQDEDWNVTVNGETYTVVSSGERITLGYKLFVVPFAALTVEQIRDHQCPPIFIAFTNSYGIRKVVITGEVL